ncbi:MAG TPA: hypothetical protein VM219_09105 [Phycisphaerae bacterium]|nr:hypothetical protein [Phycisphaerae bacterium]HUX02975.1 hypothetical protein [Phycisphaerae bacterium]
MDKPQYVTTQRTGKGVKLAILISGLGMLFSLGGAGASVLAESGKGIVLSILAFVACAGALLAAKIVRWWRYE